MTLRNKTLLIIGTTLITLLGSLELLSQTILLNSFIKLEEQGVYQNVERARAALFNQFTALDSIASDWALWDDSYTFMEDQNEA